MSPEEEVIMWIGIILGFLCLVAIGVGIGIWIRGRH